MTSVCTLGGRKASNHVFSATVCGGWTTATLVTMISLLLLFLAVLLVLDVLALLGRTPDTHLETTQFGDYTF